MDEKQAIRRLKNGDISGLEFLVACHQVKAVRTAYLITRDPGLAEDIVQDAFLRAFHAMRGFDEARPFEPWFMKSVVNASVKVMQRSARQVQVSEEADESLLMELAARVESVDSQLLPFLELRPDQSIDSGYEFTIQSLDPSLHWNVGVSLARPEGSTDAGFVDCIGYLDGEPGATTTHTVTCRGLPGQTLEATIYEISVQLDDLWEIDWDLPAQ